MNSKENNAVKAVSEHEKKPLPKELTERYEPLECFAHNELSETYLVRSLSDGGTFVAKIYDKGLASDMPGEREILSSLEHPSIPKMTDSFETEGSVCVIREYAEGTPLDRITEPVTERGLLNIGVQLCDVLSYLHSQKPPIIHRDIKPSNVIIDGENKIRLIDFGIARRYNETASKDTAFIGSEFFAPPEQYGFKQTDSLSDIYSLGVLLCWLATGSSDVLELDGMKNKELAKAIKKCSAFSPKDRYKTAETAKTALIRACGGGRYIKKALLSVAAVAVVAGVFILGRLTAPAIPTSFDYEKEPQNPATEEVTETVANQVTDEDTDVIKFKEPLIETAARFLLEQNGSLKEGEELTARHLAEIRILYIIGDRIYFDNDQYQARRSEDDFYNAHPDLPLITSLEDLKYMPYMEELFIKDQQITDIEPVGNLHLLYALSLSGNPIENISPVKNLWNLELLDVERTNVSDLTPTFDLPKLTSFWISDCPNLKTNLGQLQNLKTVNHFTCTGKILDVYKQLPSIEFFYLCLSKSDFDSLSWIPSQASIHYLSVDETNLTSLNGIEKFTELEVLNISYCDITDLTSLLSCPNLKSVYVSGLPHEVIEEIAGQAKFEIFDNNKQISWNVSKD